ncbi:hypothetical protein DsansV1_C04g0042371 [Dioscorea sansibarensis]
MYHPLSIIHTGTHCFVSSFLMDSLDFSAPKCYSVRLMEKVFLPVLLIIKCDFAPFLNATDCLTGVSV